MQDFLLFLDHFAKHTKVSPENKVLHKVIRYGIYQLKLSTFAKKRELCCLPSLPTAAINFSHWEAFTAHLRKGWTLQVMPGWRWILQRRWRSDIPSIVKTALPAAATPRNIQAGFQSTGAWPWYFWREWPSQVTDRPDPGMPFTNGAFQPASPPTPQHGWDNNPELFRVFMHMIPVLFYSTAYMSFTWSCVTHQTSHSQVIHNTIQHFVTKGKSVTVEVLSTSWDA